MTSMDLFDYTLPAEQIAQEPAARRDSSRTLFLSRHHRRVEEGLFSDLPERLTGDECLVVNDTRVLPARIRTRRESGGMVEVFLLRPEGERTWRAWLSPSRRVREGERLLAGSDVIEVIARCGRFWRLRVESLETVQRLGEVPLPHYIDRAASDPRLHTLDAERYQTIFARRPGAVAAPTAGLHFSSDVLAALAAKSIPVVPVTLHVGPGTFEPVRCATAEEHRVDPELYEVSAESRDRLVTARREGRRLICVGTTTLRLLESLPDLDEGPKLVDETDLTIVPGHRFRHAEGLITNFHLPRSSLLVLVCAFHGREHTLAAYREAIARGFRFYSYGDAMIIRPGGTRC